MPLYGMELVKLLGMLKSHLRVKQMSPNNKHFFKRCKQQK